MTSAAAKDDLEHVAKERASRARQWRTTRDRTSSERSSAKSNDGAATVSGTMQVIPRHCKEEKGCQVFCHVCTCLILNPFHHAWSFQYPKIVAFGWGGIQLAIPTMSFTGTRAQPFETHMDLTMQRYQGTSTPDYRKAVALVALPPKSQVKSHLLQAMCIPQRWGQGLEKLHRQRVAMQAQVGSENVKAQMGELGLSLSWPCLKFQLSA